MGEVLASSMGMPDDQMLASAAPAAAPRRPRSADNAARGGYTAENIQVLEGLEAVRRRPGMYIWTTDTRGLHPLVYEVVDNSGDEALADRCDTITVPSHADNRVTVADNGRRIPGDVVKGAGKSALETVLTVRHAGGRFGGGGY